MGQAPKDERQATEVVNARKLPVHLEWQGDDDDRTLHGWVACELRGPIELQGCSACRFSRGTMLAGTGGPPEVLCAWSPAADERSATSSASRP